MNKIYISFFLFISSFATQAQCPNFTKSYDGAGSSDEGYSIIITEDSGFALVGNTSYSDGFLIKTDSCGNVQWTKNYDYKGQSEALKKGIRTFDGGYLLVGSTFSISSFKNDIFVVRTNSIGDTLWEKSIGGSDNDYATSVVETSDTNYIIAGYTASYGIGGTDAYIVKIDTSGNVITQKTFGGSNDEVLNAIISTKDGGYALFGNTNSIGSGSEDFYLIKIGGALDSMWVKTQGGSNSDFGNSLVQTNDSGYVMVGSSGSYTTSSTQDILVLKTDKQGNFVWKKIFDSGFSDVGNSIDTANNGGFLVSGTFPLTGSNYDMYMMELNQTGNTVFTKRMGTIGNQFGNAIVAINDSQWLSLGSTDFTNSGDFYLVKGTQQIVLGINENKKEGNLSVFPNPVSDILYINLEIEKDKSFEVKNILGQSILSGSLNFSTGKTSLSTEKLPKGIYFLKVNSNERPIIIRFIKE